MVKKLPVASSARMKRPAATSSSLEASSSGASSSGGGANVGAVATPPPLPLMPSGEWVEVHGWQYNGPNVSQCFLWPIVKDKSKSRSGSRPPKGAKASPPSMKVVKAKAKKQ